MTHVDFNTAKLLKEAGYSGDCTHCYMHGELQDEPLLWQYHDEDYFHPAPDLYTASDWLRGVHGLHISIDSFPFESWFWEVQDVKNNGRTIYARESPTHPAALAAAITKACEIVKERKTK